MVLTLRCQLVEESHEIVKTELGFPYPMMGGIELVKDKMEAEPKRLMIEVLQCPRYTSYGYTTEVLTGKMLTCFSNAVYKGKLLM